jgi:hypothetical protein
MIAESTRLPPKERLASIVTIRVSIGVGSLPTIDYLADLFQQQLSAAMNEDTAQLAGQDFLNLVTSPTRTAARRECREPAIARDAGADQGCAGRAS